MRGIPFDYGRKRRGGIFRCKSDRNERSGLFVTLIVRSIRCPTGYRSLAFPPIRFIGTSIERIGSIETVDRLLMRRGFHPRCRANNSLRRVENAAVVRRRRRRRRTAAGALLLLLLCIYLRDRTKDTIFMAVKGQWNWNWRKLIDWKLLDWREINFRLLNVMFKSCVLILHILIETCCDIIAGICRDDIKSFEISWI